MKYVSWTADLPKSAKTNGIIFIEKNPYWESVVRLIDYIAAIVLYLYEVVKGSTQLLR